MADDVTYPADHERAAPDSLTTVGPGGSLIVLRPEQRFPKPQVMQHKPRDSLGLPDQMPGATTVTTTPNAVEAAGRLCYKLFAAKILPP